MNIYLQIPQPSRGLQRIADALTRYRPAGSTIVTDLHQADLVILYAIGRNDAITEKAHSIQQRGQRYAVIQVCLRSTMRPHTSHWRYLWENAACVWSYYDLHAAIMEDEQDNVIQPLFFYHAPLGVDAEVFQVHPHWKERDIVILSSGQSRLSESVRECHVAAQQLGLKSAHLGDVRLNGVDCYSGMDDNTLRALYNTCHFVSGLRRTEGFELPAAEGLLCGSRPVCFDSADYRWCYKDFAEYIHEGTRAEVVEQLVELFKAGARPVTAEERGRAVEWFDWKLIIGGFYERLA